jgi:hypothetical protein
MVEISAWPNSDDRKGQFDDGEKTERPEPKLLGTVARACPELTGLGPRKPPAEIAEWTDTGESDAIARAPVQQECAKNGE